MSAIKSPTLSASTSAVRAAWIQTSKPSQLEMALSRNSQRYLSDEMRINYEKIALLCSGAVRLPLDAFFARNTPAPAMSTKDRAMAKMAQEWITALGYTKKAP